MKRLLTAIIVKDLSLFGIVLGSANSWGWLITISGIGFVAGLILLAFALDALAVFFKPMARYHRRVENVAENQREQAAYRDMMDKTNNRRLSELEKRGSQTIKGYIRKSGEVINFERKEA